MPTGYTQGIVDGKITTFEEFARICTRQFGATSHMREDPLDSEYRPRTPSEFLVNTLQSLKEELERIESMSDDEILAEEEYKIAEQFRNYSEHLINSNQIVTRMRLILLEVYGWSPPTDEHYKLKDFMSEQLLMTINAEPRSYYIEKIESLRRLIHKGIDPNSRRNELLSELKLRISQIHDQLEDEIERCKASNEWMEDFFRSLKPE